MWVLNQLFEILGCLFQAVCLVLFGLVVIALSALWTPILAFAIIVLILVVGFLWMTGIL